MSELFEFDGRRSGDPDGVAAWRRQRDEATRALGLKLGLPLNRKVEVWLRGGIRLSGVLSLRETPLFLDAVDIESCELVVGGVAFRRGEIESCVRLD